jgi:hypothetical protein
MLIIPCEVTYPAALSTGQASLSYQITAALAPAACGSDNLVLKIAHQRFMIRAIHRHRT